jgi:glycosyltransferase involved in cell wall biosynthesis
LNIALLHFTAPPVVGGVERVIEEHARLFRAEGHAVRIVAGETLRSPTLGRELREFDVVIAHNLLTMPFAPAVTGKLRTWAAEWKPTRFIAWTHDVAAANPWYASENEGGLMRNWCRDFEYVAVSERRRQELHVETGMPLERCIVIPNGVSPAEHWGAALEWRELVETLAPRDLVLLHPARLVRRKRIEVSLAVLAELRRSGVDATLLVTAPDDPHQRAGAEYRAELLAKRTELGLESHAIFLSELGPVTAADVDAFYRLADAVIFPSEQEGFGLPMLEAVLHRTPIFCPAIEPLTSLPAAEGAFYPVGAAPEQIAEQIMRTIAGCAAIRLRKEAVRDYSWPAVYRKCIAPLLAGPQTPHS